MNHYIELPPCIRAVKRYFDVFKDPNFTVSMDGYDKLCGYQKSMFPLSINGAQDTFSGKIIFLKIWTSNNDPAIIGRHYFEYVIRIRHFLNLFTFLCMFFS